MNKLRAVPLICKASVVQKSLRTRFVMRAKLQGLPRIWRLPATLIYFILFYFISFYFSDFTAMQQSQKTNEIMELKNTWDEG